MFRTQWPPQMKPSKSPVTSVISGRAQEHAHVQGGKREEEKKEIRINGKKSRPKTKIEGGYFHPKM